MLASFDANKLKSNFSKCEYLIINKKKLRSKNTNTSNLGSIRIQKHRKISEDKYEDKRYGFY